MEMTLRISKNGRRVLLCWALMLGALGAPFVFWQGAGPGLLFCALWALACAAVWQRARHFCAVLYADGHLEVHAGFAIRTRRTVLPGAIVATARVSTPLLQLAHCRVTVLSTAGGLLFLPAVDAGEAAALCAALCPDERQGV